MKSQTNFKHTVFLFFIAVGLIVLNSCAVYNSAQRTSLPIDEIIRLSKEGVPSKDIIKQMRSTHSVYTLPANELARLSREGVQDSVINYMEKTHINLIRRQQEATDSYYGYPGMYGYYGYPYYGFGYGLGFGWPYGYLGWGYGPSVIIHRSVPYHGSNRGIRER